MSEIKFKIEIESDNDGYVAFECPFCETIFGLKSNEYQEWLETNNEIYCPCCGLKDNKDNFYTKEVVEQIKQIALNSAYEQINTAFTKMAKSMSNNKYIKMTYKPLKTTRIDNNIKTEESSDEIFECKSCQHHLKVNYIVGKSRIYCSYCGRDI